MLVLLVYFYTEANAAQENRLNVFHMRSLRKLLGITWMSRTPNTVVLSRCGQTTMFTMLRQRRLRWLGHVRQMNDGRIPRDLLYGELSAGRSNIGRPQLRYRVQTRYERITKVLIKMNGKSLPLIASSGEVICKTP